MNDAAELPATVDPRLGAAVDRAVTAHGHEPGPLLVVLQAVMAELGHLPSEVVPLVADGLNLSRAEVHGVISFYSDLHSQRRGAHVVQVCRAEACQAVGGSELVRHVTERLGVGLEQTSADGAYTLEGVFCLGNCALGPAAAIDGRLLGRVDSSALIDRIAQLESRGAPA